MMRNKTLKWLWQVPGRNKGIIAVLTGLQMLNGLTGVASALLLRSIVDSAVRQDVHAFGRTTALMVALILGEQGLNALVRRLYELGRATLENVFKLRLMDQLLHRSYRAVSAVHSGEWMNRLTNDTKVVADNYTEILPDVAVTIIRLVSALTMIVVLDTRFALLILAGGLLLIVLTYAFRKKLKQFHRSVQEKDGKLRILLQERIGCLMMIKSFAAEEKTMEEAAERMEEHKTVRMKRNRFSNLCNIGFGIGMQGMFLLGVSYCAWGMLQGTVSYGTLAAVMDLLNQIQRPFANISGYLPRYYAMIASAERLMNIEEAPGDLQEPMKTAAEIRQLYRDQLTSFGMHHADYTYLPTEVEGTGDERERMPVVLRDFTLEIRKGEYTAFTGHSGCGKSTVLKLLMGLYPLDGGRITILRKDGSVIPLTPSHRRMFAYVPQGNQLMTGTIREIVSFASEGREDEDRIRASLRIACAEAFAEELPDGIDTLLGERGAGLSEGQMQRIAIARALYADAPVLLLDEATSALDAATEEKLLNNLKELTDKTVIIVTHRPAALEICDRVLEFTENGVREK